MLYYSVVNNRLFKKYILISVCGEERNGLEYGVSAYEYSNSLYSDIGCIRMYPHNRQVIYGIVCFWHRVG